MIEVTGGRTGTFVVEIIDYAAGRGSGNHDAPVLARSPDLPGTAEGMERCRLWICGELRGRLGVRWRDMLGAEAFMLPGELDVYRPGWRRVPVVYPDGRREVRTIEHPVFSLTLETQHMCVPLRRNSDAMPDIGVVVTGPLALTEEALAAQPTYSEEEIDAMMAGLRPFPSRPS